MVVDPSQVFCVKADPPWAGSPEVFSGPSDRCRPVVLDWDLHTRFVSPRFYAQVHDYTLFDVFKTLTLFKNLAGAVIDLTLGRFNVKETSVIHLVAFHHPSKACIWLRDFYVRRQEGEDDLPIQAQLISVSPLTDKRFVAF